MDTTREQRRDVGWVLRQAAVVGVLALVAVHLTGVICLTLRHRELASAATKAAAEARMPRATLASVEQQAHRLLDSRHGSATIAVSIFRTPSSNLDARRLQPGDRVAVKIAAPARPLLPAVLARLAPWLAREEIIAEAKAIVP